MSGRWTKAEVERLANHERAAGARSRIFEIKERILELLHELGEEQTKLNKAREVLAEANTFLKGIGEETYDE